jgi:hypothetical protein
LKQVRHTQGCFDGGILWQGFLVDSSFLFTFTIGGDKDRFEL